MEPTLRPEERVRVDVLLRSYPSAAARNAKSPRTITLVTHDINTGDARPIKTHPYRVSRAEHDIVNKEVSDMQRDGIIEPSRGEWSSAVVLVRKKDGTIRFCVDYRRLNAVTEKDVYSLPRSDDTLDRIGKACYVTTPDLASGYWQVNVTFKDRSKAAFATREGLFQFIRMPFGLCNAPATFQRMMNSVLHGMIGTCVLVYIDDIIVFSDDFESHIKHVQLVLDRLMEAGLQVKPTKCKDAFREVEFLGHVVSERGIEVDKKKVQAMIGFPRPTSIPTLRSFLGLVNYYRRFVDHFSTRVAPLYALTEKGRTWEWCDESEHAFMDIKAALASVPVLRPPDHTRPFVLQVDASDTGLGAVLSQSGDNDDEWAVAYASRAFSQSREELSHDREGMFSNSVGYKAVSCLPLGSAVRSGERS